MGLEKKELGSEELEGLEVAIDPAEKDENSDSRTDQHTSIDNNDNDNDNSDDGEKETSNPDNSSEEEEKPFWLQDEEDTDEDSQTSSGSVPEATLVHIKKKLKGKIREKDDEIQALRRELEELKAQKAGGSADPQIEKPKRPRLEDFDTEEEFEAALDEYEEKKLEYIQKVALAKQQQELEAQKRAEQLARSIDAHYERASKLVKEAGISPEVYQQADAQVKEAIEEVLPGAGESVFNEFVNIVGEGSEKAMFYLGRNKTAREQFKSLLATDRTGLKAVFQLGQIVAKINGAQTVKTSRAPKPATEVKGDASPSSKSNALLRKYREAHKRGDVQLAYNIKKQAKAEGIDTSTWS